MTMLANVRMTGLELGGQPHQTLLDQPPEGLPDWQPGQPKPATWPAHIHPPREVADHA